jgi:hypothetical protein
MGNVYGSLGATWRALPEGGQTHISEEDLKRPILTSAVAVLAAVSHFLDRLLRNNVLRALGFIGWLGFVVLGTATLSVDGGGLDYWQHLAAVRAIASNVADPPALFFTESYQVYLYTPYHLFWAIAKAIFNVSIWDLVTVMAVVNAAIFAIGARLVAKHLFHDPGLDFAALITFLAFWYQPVWWRGFYSLGEILPQAMCSSFFALGLSLIVAALWMEEYYRAPSWCVSLSILVAIVFTSHPVTGGFLVLFLVLKSTAYARLDWQLLLVSAPMLAVALTLAWLWPFYSLSEVMGASSVWVDHFGDFGVFYRNVHESVGPELLGVLALPLIRERRLRFFLLFMLAAVLAVHTSDLILGLPYLFSRYLIYVTLVLHLCVIGVLSSSRGRVWSAVVVVLFLATAGYSGYAQLRIATGNSFSLVRDLRESARVGTNSVAAKYLDLTRIDRPEDDSVQVMMAPLDWAYRVSALTDYKVVGVMHPAPGLPDFEGRQLDVSTFYEPETARAAREEIVQRREVDYVLVPLDEVTGEPLLQLHWNPVFEGSNFTLYGIPSEDEE